MRGSGGRPSEGWIAGANHSALLLTAAVRTFMSGRSRSSRLVRDLRQVAVMTERRLAKEKRDPSATTYDRSPAERFRR